MLTDRFRSSSILHYQHPVFHALEFIVASTLHGRLRNCDLSDTVGFTPHICKGNHDGLCYAVWQLVSTQKLFPLSYETLHPSFLRVSFKGGF